MTAKHVLAIVAVAAAVSCPDVVAGQAAPTAPAGGQAPAAEAPFVLRAGPADATRQLTAFCDFEDAACARLVVVLRSVLESRPENLSIVFRHLAPATHRQSRLAYRAALAAARQGRGWEMLDMALANQDRLHDQGLQGMAAQLGLDLARFVADTGVDAVSQVLDDDAEEAKKLGVESVPALFLNGKRLENVLTHEGILAAVKPPAPSPSSPAPGLVPYSAGLNRSRTRSRAGAGPMAAWRSATYSP